MTTRSCQLALLFLLGAASIHAAHPAREFLSHYCAECHDADVQKGGLRVDTLVICTSEFGRQPGAQGKGRDHNPGAFTAWMAGGGIKGGSADGSTDDLGFKAAENPAYCYDLHATALHLLGLNQEKLSFYNNGIARRLTDVHGHVLKDIIA